MATHRDEATTSLRTAQSSLADFILGNMETILQDWEDFARSLFPAAALSKTALRDHAREILLAIASDISRPQSAQVQEDKSKGLTPNNSPALRVAGERHALARVMEQFDLEQLFAEFRAVRGSVLRRWAAQTPGGIGRPDEITRFNESIDEALASSVCLYSQKHDEARTVILGVLAHDLRNPLHAALMATSSIIQDANASAKCIQSAARIKVSIGRCDQLVSDLLDYARSMLGHGLPMSPHDANMRELCSATVDEVESAHPGRFITQSYSGELNGTWDSARIVQVLGNLLTNALKHGHSDTPVLLTVTGGKDTVSVEIHNDGPPIPAAALGSLFEPLYLKGVSPGHLPEGSSGLGLGLYICREIALAHGGDINVTSSSQSGTSFKLTLPSHTTPDRSSSL
jgi:signal transduction histidine kinase